MIRKRALKPLAQHHEEARAIAQRLCRLNVDDMSRVQSAFLRFWEAHGRDHFRTEEKVLLPAYAKYAGEENPLIMRLLSEHRLIRQRADRITPGSEEPLSALRTLGEQLAEHVRLEDRELFPLMEKTLPAHELERLGSVLAGTVSDAGLPPISRHPATTDARPDLVKR